MPLGLTLTIKPLFRRHLTDTVVGCGHSVAIQIDRKNQSGANAPDWVGND